MFKGISKIFKEKLERFNEESEFFTFSFYDLEPGNYDKYSNKFYLYSDELKQKLNRIIQERKQPGENIPFPRSIFFRVPLFYSYSTFCFDGNSWIVFTKDSIYQMAKRGVEEGKNNLLIYDGGGKEEYISTTPVWGKWSVEVSRAISKERDLYEELKKKLSQLRQSSLNEINQAIEKTKIDLNSLEIRYPDLIPYDCRCEMIPNQDGTWKNPCHYQNHINNCLGRDETELIEFKEAMLEQIRLGKISFENYRNSIIAEVKAIAVEKNVQEGSFWSIGDWKEWLHSSNLRSSLQFQKKCLVENIERCAKSNADNLRWQAEANRIAEENARWEALRQAQAKTEAWRKEQERKAQQEAARLEQEKKQRERAEAQKRTQQAEKEKAQQEKEAKRNLPSQLGEKPFAELNLSETQEMVQKSLAQTLATHHLQNTDLPEEFHHWAEKLKKLKTKEEVLLYQDFFLDSVARVVEERKDSSPAEQPKSNPWLGSLMIGGGIFLVFLILFFFLKRVTRT